jgi:hypothetical protein
MARVLRLISPVALSLSLCGCILPGDGPDPPLDQFYFPTGLALNSDATRLYVANSDFDLQYNQGTLLAIDLDRAEGRYLPVYCTEATGPTVCAAGTFCDYEIRPDGTAPSHWCVKSTENPCGALGEDGAGNIGQKTAAERLLFPGRCSHLPLYDPTRPKDVENFITGSAQIDAFASDLIFRPWPLNVSTNASPSDPAFREGLGRIFATVRGNESLTFADVAWPPPDQAPLDPLLELNCGEPSLGAKCTDVFSRGEEGDDVAENDRFSNLPPEPNAVAGDLRGEVLVVAHQTQTTASLFENTWNDPDLDPPPAPGSDGPTLEYLVGGLPEHAIDVAAVPEPRIIYEDTTLTVEYRPSFLLTFRTTPQIIALRYYSDDASENRRPFLTVGGRVDVTANSLSFDSRGIALETSKRTACEDACPEVSGTPRSDCLKECANVPLGVFVANRTPSSVLLGQTLPNSSLTASDDLPDIYDSIPLSTGPSTVVTGQVKGVNGEAVTRIFIVCFDSRLIYIYDPVLQRVESIIRTGRGPQALTIGRTLNSLTRESKPTGLGYIGMFTDSYVGIVDLDMSHTETYGTILMTLGTPVVPRASE